VPLEWDENYNFDVKTFKENTRRICEHGAHAVYTTGSTGEFFSIDLEEFKIMVDAFVEVTKDYDIFTGVGTTAFNTREVLRMAQYCADKKIDAVMPAFPCWLPLRQDECLKFLQAVCGVSPDLGVIHYNISRSKVLFEGKDYKRVLPDLPKNFLGSKSTNPDFVFQYKLIKESPELVHFPGESVFTPNMMFGGKGIISVVYCMNPDWCNKWYQVCVNKEWEEAIRMQKYWNDYLIDIVLPILEQGYLDPAIDRAQVIAAGFLTGSNRLRAPHSPVPDAIIADMRKQMLRDYPDLVYVK
jgi:dihydrodipicolinate synthase/N-acetylneuraminate lyase